MSSAGVVDPTVLAVFGIPDDTPADIVDEILTNCQDGTSGPELQKLWEDHFLREDVDEDHAALTTLDRIRQEMTLEGIEKNAKAKSTFTTRQSENTLFILWLYHHGRDLLEDDMLSAILDTIQNVDYSSLVRTGKRRYRGKKALLTRKVEYLKDQYRKVIAEFLGAVGSSPPRRTVKLVKLTEDDNHNTFVSYLASRRQTNGGLYKPNVYKGCHSGLSFLFFRYGVSKPTIFEDKVKNAMMGIKRNANCANQCGEGDIGDGKRPLSFELYKQFNIWFLALGTHKGLFGHAFAKLTFNLACRGDSTG